jgi:5,5'-dehydrodivanillate O-demethylase
MLTKEESQRLTQVGPGTPAGELLRRYWHPVAVAEELTEAAPTKFVRLLGEDLVLFRDLLGRVGLLAERCAHRGASLVYGRVEERGISCPYHGWLYDRQGSILETPPEKNDAICRNVKQRAYPVEQVAGLYWAYLGPLPAPAFPKYDVLARTDGSRQITVHPMLDCNWLQTMENAADPAHAPILHQDAVGRTAKPVNSTRGFIDDQESFEFWRVPYGLMKRRNFKNGESDEHPLIFPNMLRTGGTIQIRVPVDDVHTWRVDVKFTPDPQGAQASPDERPAVKYLPAYKSPPDALHPFAQFETRTVPQQDHMVWETQGLVVDRSGEHLSFSDRALIELRKMVQENIEKVERGEDPLAVLRDPEHAVIDTNLDHDLMATGGKTGRGRPYGFTTGTL